MDPRCSLTEASCLLMNPPSTPVPKSRLMGLVSSTPAMDKSRSPAIKLPATPFLSRLGYGTGVSVYLYERSPTMGKIRSPWAVKKVNRKHAKTAFGKRLVEEAKILRSLNHPNIIQYKAFTGSEDGLHVLAMEHGQKSLADRIEEREEAGQGSFQAETVENTVGWVATALNYLHTDRLIMHGDIKSANILVVGNFETIKLCDFGVTLPLDRNGSVTQPDVFYVGTEAWTPREVLLEEIVTSKADIFAFGLVIFEMLSLHAPHIDKLLLDDSDDEDAEEGESKGEKAFRAVLGTRPPLPDTVTLDGSYRKVLEIFFSATEADYRKRPTAAQVLELLEEEQEDDSILCVNIVSAGIEDENDDEGDDSIMCVEEDDDVTPPAV